MSSRSIFEVKQSRRVSVSYLLSKRFKKTHLSILKGDTEKACWEKLTGKVLLPSIHSEETCHSNFQLKWKCKEVLLMNFVSIKQKVDNDWTPSISYHITCNKKDLYPFHLIFLIPIMFSPVKLNM